MRRSSSISPLSLIKLYDSVGKEQFMSNYRGRPNKPSKDLAQIGNMEVRAQS